MKTMPDIDQTIEQVARVLKDSKHAIAFTGAGISLESGVPTFRGNDEDNIWSRYDPEDIEISRFMSNPAKSWKTIKDCFYFFMQDRHIEPNVAHKSLAKMEEKGIVRAVITQNIDNLHQEAGSHRVIEFHGTTRTATCVRCHKTVEASQLDMSQKIPSCDKCGGLMKPDFVFFGEGIPSEAYSESMNEAEKADVCIVVGSSAVVMPAAMIPVKVKQNGGVLIEINPTPSALTHQYVDYYLPLGAVEAFTRIGKAIKI